MDVLKKIKLLVVTNSLAKGGAEKLIEVTLPHFKNNGIEVTLMLLNAKASFGPYLESIHKAGIEIIDLDANNIYSPSLVIKIRRILKSVDFNVIHVHLFPSIYLISLAFKFLPQSRKNNLHLVYTEHSNHNKRREKGYLLPIEKWMYSSFSKIIAITNEVKSKLDDWIGFKNKTEVINNGIDILSINEVNPINRVELCQQLNINDRAFLILMSASFRYPKDQATLLRAIHKLEDCFHVLFAGEGPEEGKIKDLVFELGLQNRVHFLGFRGDVISLMKSVDLNVLSTNYEGLSGVTLESLASNKPFLGSDVDGVRDVVPNKIFLFPSNNHEVLSKKIFEIYSDIELRNVLVREGSQHVLKYDINGMIMKYMEVYKKLIGSNEKN